MTSAMSSAVAREFDIVLFGATGFTGRLVAEYLAAAAAASSAPPLRWAIAGRNRDKLAQLGIAPPPPILVADALDPAAMRGLAERTAVVCTTTGPYARYGSALVGACADAGTHYCDLTGEVPWMRRMIDAHHARAGATGARIVHTCGFDSIPSDLGCWATQQAFIERFGDPARRITALYGEQAGGFSGGTAASAFDLAREAADDPAVRALVANPYALDPDPSAPRPRAPDPIGIGWQPRLKVFTVPFVMAQVNTRVVRRGHALAGQPWGAEFVYRELMSTPGSPRGAAMAVGITGAVTALGFAMTRASLRDRLARRAPRPGEGPSPEVRARGHWIVRFVAEDDRGNALTYVASDRADPGYGSTCKMIGESALCLARDPLTSPGGVLTPSVAMARPLVDRLRRAGLVFAPA
jgi:short subunit dehydrogenase-like uncharacterized protein